MSILDEVVELEEVTADCWQAMGTIWPTEYGNENTYYTDEFDTVFFCKNYPDNELYGYAS